MQVAAGTLVADRFELIRELGRGGMGAVWLAHHTGLDTACAVKLIHPEMVGQPEVRGRFEREAKAAALIRGPHVAQVIDYGESEGVPYLVMEYLEGEDLARRIQRAGPLSRAETVMVIRQVARALAKAHANGLVHRDLKPDNVFLTGDADQPLVKVLDFGVAKGGITITSGATQTGVLLGTPHYMSPEQAQGSRAVDLRSDLWSLGVLAFVCLTGELPFFAEGYADLLMAICALPGPVPSQVRPDLPPAFDAWWARACAKQPADRFSSAREQAEALAHALLEPSTRSSVLSPALAPLCAPTSAAAPAPAPFSRPTVLPVSHTVVRPRAGHTTLAVSAIAAFVLVASSAAALALAGRDATPMVASSAAAIRRERAAAAIASVPAPSASGPAVTPAPASPTPSAPRRAQPIRTKKRAGYDPGLL